MHKGDFSLLSGLQIPPNYLREIFPSDISPLLSCASPPAGAFYILWPQKYNLLFSSVRIFSLEGVSCFRFSPSLRLPSGRIEAAAGFPVGCGRFIGSGLTVAPSGNYLAPEGFFRGRCCLRWRGEPQHLKREASRSIF